jgi:endoglucanase
LAPLNAARTAQRAVPAQDNSKMHPFGQPLVGGQPSPAESESDHRLWDGPTSPRPGPRPASGHRPPSGEVRDLSVGRFPGVALAESLTPGYQHALRRGCVWLRKFASACIGVDQRLKVLIDTPDTGSDHAGHMSAPVQMAGRMIALALLLFAGAGAGAAVEAPDAFAVNRQIGRGINLGNALEAPVEGEWGITIREEYFDVIKSAGFNSVRIAVRWSAHARADKPYTMDADFFNRTDEVIAQALARGFVVILTMHHYNELYADPAGHRERFLAIWKQIAARYKNHPATLIFEPLNEPHDRLGAAGWNQLIKELLPVIRETNPGRKVVLGPVNYNDIRQLNALELPPADRNLIVSVHYYLPYPFTHQGAHWQAGSDAWLGTRWTGSDAEKQAIRDDFDLAASWAKTNHRPLFIGEFGANRKADMESRARWTRFVADAAIERGFSFTYWDFCAEFFGLYDPPTKRWNKELLEAIIPPTARERG